MFMLPSVVNIFKAFDSNSHSKLKTKETDGSISDGDVIGYDDIGFENVINDYFSSVCIDDNLHIPESSANSHLWFK